MFLADFAKGKRSFKPPRPCHSHWALSVCLLVHILINVLLRREQLHPEQLGELLIDTFQLSVTPAPSAMITNQCWFQEASFSSQPFRLNTEKEDEEKIWKVAGWWITPCRSAGSVHSQRASARWLFSSRRPECWKINRLIVKRAARKVLHRKGKLQGAGLCFSWKMC